MMRGWRWLTALLGRAEEAAVLKYTRKQGQQVPTGTPKLEEAQGNGNGNGNVYDNDSNLLPLPLPLLDSWTLELLNS